MSSQDSRGRKPSTAGTEAAVPRGAKVSDWQLVEQTAARDGCAFEALVARHKGRLRRIVLSRRGDIQKRGMLQDILNETWFQALRRALSGDFDPSIRFSSWLVGLCLNVMKKREFRPSGISLTTVRNDGTTFTLDPQDGEVLPGDTVARGELMAALAECLAVRDERELRLYELFYVDGRTKVDTARELRCSEAYVRQKLLPRLHEALARCLARKGFREQIVGDFL